MIVLSGGMDAIRAKRDQLLAQCDYTQHADSPLDAGWKRAWATYRQKLRDVTTQSLPVTWPEIPTSPEPIAPVGTSVSDDFLEEMKAGETVKQAARRQLDEYEYLMNARQYRDPPPNVEQRFQALHARHFELKRLVVGG